MKFKDIRPGMAIRCMTWEEAEVLIERLRELGYVWWGDGKELTDVDYTDGDTYFLESIFGKLEVSQDFYENAIRWGHSVTDFSDLIDESEPDESNAQMSAVEVLKWLKEHGTTDEMATLFGYHFHNSLLNDFSPEEIVQKITAYEAEKKKPKPVEIEWVDVCKICDGKSGARLVEYELEAKKDEDKTLEIEEMVKRFADSLCGEFYTVIERRCRVKK